MENSQPEILVITIIQRLQSIVISVLINAYVYTTTPYATLKAAGWKRRLPNPADPRRAVDKYLWRKVFDHNPDFTAMSDKLIAKRMAQDRCPHVCVPRTLWTGSKFGDIPPQLLSQDVVIKANHGSGFHVILRDGNIDHAVLERETRRWMSRDYSRHAGEWNYAGISRKLFAEEFLKDTNGIPVRTEAKIYVFGSTALFAVCFNDRLTSNPSMSLYDRDGNAFPVGSEINMRCNFQPPDEQHRRMFLLAEQLAAGMDHVRIDLYIVDGDIYFSEFTLHPLAGKLTSNMYNAFPDVDAMWDLRKTWFLTHPQPGWRGTYARWLKRQLDQRADRARTDAAR